MPRRSDTSPVKAKAATAMDDIVTKNRRSAVGLEPRQRPTRSEAEAAVRTLIAWAGDDPEREGLRIRHAA
jgi:GTP cyclohydrolase IA